MHIDGAKNTIICFIAFYICCMYLIYKIIFFSRGKQMSAALQEVTPVMNDGLAENINKTVKTLLQKNGGKTADLQLHQVIVEAVEAPMLRSVMELTRYNQSKAARVLGISRGTLRTKLKRYFDDEFIGTREED